MEIFRKTSSNVRVFTGLFLSLLLIAGGVDPATAERTISYYHTDALGSVVAASDADGNLLWRKTYSPYGEQIDIEDDNEALSYTGKPHDDNTGLTYFGARYYDPQVGRFMGMDPAGVREHVSSNPMMFNRYAYGNNNPYRYVDPDGNIPVETAWDLTNVGMGVVSFSTNVAIGNYWGATLDAVGLVVDGAATVVPYVPGGAGTAIKGFRASQKLKAVTKRRVLKDGEGASAADIAASKGGPTGGSRAGQAQRRQELIDEANQNNGGVYTCWRCGQTSTNPADMHLGHRNVPTSKDGNLSKPNTCLEGAACNLSAGNRGAPKPGMSCAERGSCGAPYGR